MGGQQIVLNEDTAMRFLYVGNEKINVQSKPLDDHSS